jgi:5-deoxy-glucuronate isomerase
MPSLPSKPAGAHGRVQNVTPENAGWTYVGFDPYRLGEGAAAAGDGDVVLIPQGLPGV